MRRCKPVLFLLAASAPLCAPAHGQRTDDNATVAATDAFGRSIGDEEIGIYDPGNVRGFSPIDAGNVRLEGLYYAEYPGLNARLVQGSRVHVGISAQGYPFPAPTGIADFTLRRAGAHPLLSAVARYGPFGSEELEVDAQLPFAGERLGVAFGAALRHVGENYGAAYLRREEAATLAFRPSAGTELLGFWSEQRDSGEEAQPVAFTAPGTLPPRVPRGPFTGQSWAQYTGHGRNFGLIAKTGSGRFRLAAGLFRSLGRISDDFSDLLTGVDPDGAAADRLIVADRNERLSAYSGELRASYAFDEGPRRHELVAMLRGRQDERIYGGSDVIDLGPSRYGVADFRPAPALAFGPQSRDSVRQVTAGIGYELAWRHLGQLQFGLLSAHYVKRVSDLAGNALAPVSRDSPLLPNVAAAVRLPARLTFYASHTRGLEESPVAPAAAANRNQAPPAIRTRQSDAGLSWAATRDLSLIAGVFEVEKPYFFLDDRRIFRRLGTLRNRGVELSLAGRIATGLNIVAGSVFLDPRVTGEGVALGLIGARPAGASARNTIVSLDYRFPKAPAFSLDAQLESTGERYGDGTVIAPRSVLSLGGRYRFALGGTRWLLRAQIWNIFNRYGIVPLSNGGYVYNAQRRIGLSLTADI